MFDTVKIYTSPAGVTPSAPILTVDTANTNYDTVYCNPQSVLSASSVRIAYAEKNYFWLDDTYIFPKNQTYPTGWVSASKASATGSLNQKLTIKTASGRCTSYGLTLYFDENSIPVNFGVTYYRGTTAIATRTIASNVSPIYQDLAKVSEWDKVVITVTTTQPLQRARIRRADVNLSIPVSSHSETGAELDVLTGVSCTKTCDVSSDNQAAGVLEFSMLNENFDLSAFADVSDDYNTPIRYDVYMKDSQLVGSTEEYFNTYYTYSKDNYSFSENGTIVSVKAYDGFYFLDKSECDGIFFLVDNTTVEEVVNAIQAKSQIAIAVSGDLASTVIGRGYIGECTCREALRQVCEAVGAVVDSDETGLVLRKVSLSEDETAEIEQDFIVDGSVTTQSRKISKLKITGHQYVQATDYEQVGLVQGVTVGVSQRFTVPLEKSPVRPASVSITSDIQPTNIKIYPDRVEFTAASNPAIDTYFSVEAIPYSDTIVTDEFGTNGVEKVIDTTLTGNTDRIMTIQKFTALNKRTVTAELFGSNYNASLLDVVTLSDENGSDTIIVEMISYNFTSTNLSYKIGGRQYALG